MSYSDTRGFAGCRFDLGWSTCYFPMTPVLLRVELFCYNRLSALGTDISGNSSSTLTAAGILFLPLSQKEEEVVGQFAFYTQNQNQWMSCMFVFSMPRPGNCCAKHVRQKRRRVGDPACARHKPNHSPRSTCSPVWSPTNWLGVVSAYGSPGKSKPSSATPRTPSTTSTSRSAMRISTWRR
jgi:hypothetical protein